MWDRVRLGQLPETEEVRTRKAERRRNGKKKDENRDRYDTGDLLGERDQQVHFINSFDML